MEAEEEWLVAISKREVFIFIYIIILLLTIIVNILFLFLFVRHPILVKTSYILHLNLSCAFIALALFAMTFSVVTIVTGKWIFPHIVCNIVGFFHRTFQMITMFTAFGVINEKFYFRIYQRRHAQLYTTKRVSISLLIYWSISILVGILPFLPSLGGYTFDPATGTCFSLSKKLKLIPLVLHAIYIVLWSHTVVSIFSLPKIRPPKDLAKSCKPGTIVPELVISGLYFIVSVVIILTAALEHYGTVFNDSNSKRLFLLVFYVLPVLIPLLSMLLYTDLKKCGGNMVSRNSSSESLYTKFAQANTPQYPYTAQRFTGADKKYMSLPSIQECHRRPPLRKLHYTTARPTHLRPETSCRFPPTHLRPEPSCRSLPRAKQSIPMIELACKNESLHRSKVEAPKSEGSYSADPTSVTSSSTVADIVEL